MKKQEKFLEKVTTGAAIIPVFLSVTSIDRKLNIQMDDIPSGNQQVQHLSQLNNQAVIGTASVSAINYNQIINNGTFNG